MSSVSPGAQNPFPADVDRFQIWEMLMRRDFEAFIAADWSMIAGDFLADEFHGVDAGKRPDPDQWQHRFSGLGKYEAEWRIQANEFLPVALKGITKLDFLFESVTLRRIEIDGGRAMAQKKFNGRATSTTGASIELCWQTLYFLRKPNTEWKITGFLGYLPTGNLVGAKSESQPAEYPPSTGRLTPVI